MLFRNQLMRYAKYRIIKSLNELLEKNKDNVSQICGVIQSWTVRLQVVIEQLKRISSRCSDGHLDDEEVNDSIREIEQIVREW